VDPVPDPLLLRKYYENKIAMRASEKLRTVHVGGFFSSFLSVGDLLNTRHSILSLNDARQKFPLHISKNIIITQKLATA
jgi:hypothetical protein